MPLFYTGVSATDPDTFGTNYQAQDENGNNVVVSVSVEVLQDHGEEAAKEVGSSKYDNSSLTGSRPQRVFVGVSDF